jgi:hypothetical protein
LVDEPERALLQRFARGIHGALRLLAWKYLVGFLN